jgi:hypothetical protein
MDPSKRFLTVVLAAGVIVLVAAIFIGERAGSGVFVAEQSSGNLETSPIITPVPQATGMTDGYGPDWKRSQTLAAAPDPGFPDPRVPPVPLPTAPPTPKPTPEAKPRWTPNPNLPVWVKQTPPPDEASASPSPAASPQASASPSAPPRTKVTPTPRS